MDREIEKYSLLSELEGHRETGRPVKGGGGEGGGGGGRGGEGLRMGNGGETKGQLQRTIHANRQMQR